MIRSYIHRCQKDGVKIVMNCEVTPELIKEEKPDSVIIATGSKTLILPIEGIDNPAIIHGSDLLDGKRQQAKKGSRCRRWNGWMRDSCIFEASRSMM